MHAFQPFRDDSKSPMLAPRPVTVNKLRLKPTATILSPTAFVSKSTWQHEGEISSGSIKANGTPLPLVWILVEDNVIPPHAVPFAKDHRGDLYIARALLEGELHLGRAAHHLKSGALINYRGRDHETSTYEVLACAPKLIWGIATSPGGAQYQQGNVILGNYHPDPTQRSPDMTRRSLLLKDLRRVIPDGMVLDPAAERRQEAFKALDGTMVVFLVHDSRSMRQSYWNQVRDALIRMLDIVHQHGAGGYDLCLSSEGERKRRVQERDLRKIFDTVSRKDKVPLAATLEKLLNLYIPLLNSESKNRAVIVVMSCDVTADQQKIPGIIVEAARQLQRKNIPEDMFDVQFMQVGSEQATTDAFNDMSDHLKEAYMLRDIGDVTTFASTKARFDADYIATVLAGGIHKDLNNNLGVTPKQPVDFAPQRPPLPPSTLFSPVETRGAIELTPREVEKVIRQVIDQCTSHLPYRLLDAHDGTIHERSAITRQLKHQIVSQQLAEQAFQEGGLEAMKDRLLTVVKNHFQYATLSHTWGDHEASYGEITSNVFDTKHSPGIFKLQNFCIAVRKLGFRWAWSDTCCIDKSDSSELQETINSMFTWYRNSAITIVHLSDVSSPSQSDLKCSRWFTRGWTLLELLAPRVLQFYSSNWTIYRDHRYNHKQDYRLMGALQRITGIPMQSLIDFHPGAQDVRERMSWAAKRTTTLAEDMTYSLAGLFDVALPICYGEGNKAFARLQSEIIARTDDTSLFDWAGQSSTVNTCLASHSSCFSEPPLPPYQPCTPANTYDETHLKALKALLVDPPDHRITNGLLSVPFQVFRVDCLHRTSSKNSETVHTYRAEARGLEHVDIETSWDLQGDDDDWGETLAPGYFLGRFLSTPSSQDAKTQSMHHPVTAPADLSSIATHLSSPFAAVLLMSRGGEHLQRISTEKRIVARPGSGWECQDVQYLSLC
ncbi:hypothetical protein HYDPIDRAFT_27595 [Hydnomerulius pinastri MD-312]|nr:hypothetical protein HYDPIDRAFT_27595 [Hydnomerulius pinastri MD-312]